jgi:hypothetical protein
MRLRLLLSILSLLVVSTVARAQSDPDQDPPVDTTYVDSTGFPVDGPDGSTDPDFDEPPPGGGGGGLGLPSGGVYFGPTFELAQLKPESLDPELSGSMVLYGLQGYVIVNGWLVGGCGTSATLYDMSQRYDEFQFGYGGVLIGYDKLLFSSVSFRFATMIGSGEVKMIKKAPRLGPPGDDALRQYTDTSGTEILERYREEEFFALRPGISLGFAPLPIMDVRISADYLLPLGGEKVGDLKTLTYGIHLMFGFGR